MDEVGHHVISLLCLVTLGRQRMDAVHFAGHRCGPVVTTATDVNGLPAPDVLARHEHLLVDDFQTLINVNSAIVGGEQVDYYIDESLPKCRAFRTSCESSILVNMVWFMLFL